jgi:NhaA family Na+:H+ antiporter
VARFTKAELDDGLGWLDVLGLALLSGLGFTVSLLIGELAYGAGSDRDDHVKVAVLLGSLLAAAGAAVILRRRNSHYEKLAAFDVES